jgi:hypothetical protein
MFVSLKSRNASALATASLPQVPPDFEPCLRQDNLGKGERCNDYTWKPFVGALWVSNPTR